MREKEKHDDLLAEASAAQQPESWDGDSTGRSDDSLSQIQRRAYELWQARGQGPDGELEDWLQAEAEINAAIGRPEQDRTEATEHNKYSRRAIAG